MKTTIVYLLKGKAKKFNEKLIKEVGEKFNERFMIENEFPSHITLKFHFETNDIRKIENFVKGFCKVHKKEKIKIKGFSNFKGFVTFLKPEFSKKALKLQKDLIENLKSLRIKPCKFDKNFKPHATITFSKTNKNFNKICRYLKTLEEPSFNLNLDNIAIFKRPRKKWKLHKEFKLK
jgi:2'-5' RNA ligase